MTHPLSVSGIFLKLLPNSSKIDRLVTSTYKCWWLTKIAANIEGRKKERAELREKRLVKNKERGNDFAL